MGRTLKTVEDLIRKYPTAKIIGDWDELQEWAVENGTSKTHNIVFTNYAARLELLGEDKYDEKKWWWTNVPFTDHYLSTHTFYGSQFVYSTKIIQMCGFNVIIDNWDKHEQKEEEN